MSASSIEMELAASIVRSHIAAMNLIVDPAAPRVILRVHIGTKNLRVVVEELGEVVDDSRIMPLSDVPDYLSSTYRGMEVVLFSITDSNAGTS